MSENRRYSGTHMSSFQYEFVQAFLSPNSPHHHLLIAPVGSGKIYISSVIVSETVKSGARRILVLAPVLALLEQYKKTLRDLAWETTIVVLDRKLIREIETLDNKNAFWANTVAVATWGTASKSDVSEFILSTKWELIVADLGYIAAGMQRASLFRSLVSSGTVDRILALSDSFEGTNTKIILGESIKKMHITRWGFKDFLSSRNAQRDARLVILGYERTKEEVVFIKQYVSLSKWISNRSRQNKIRVRLVSSSLFAAEQSLRNLRNQAIHGDMNTLLSPKGEERVSFRDEELSGDLNSDKIGKKLSEKDLRKFIDELSMTLDQLDRIQVDSKLSVLRHAIHDFHKSKQRTWIYASYQSTISYLHGALAETFPNTYFIHSQLPTNIIRDVSSRFEENGGILISSTAIATGVDLPIDNLIVYDVPGNVYFINAILSRTLYRLSSMALGKDINLVTFSDASNVLSNEESRLRKFRDSLTSLGLEITDVQ